MSIPTDWSGYTDTDLEDLANAVSAERQRRWVLATTPQQVQELADAVATANDTVPAVPWAQAGDTIAPGERIVWTDGNTWRNTSRAWLPSTADPGTYPQGYQQLTGLPPSTPDWAAGTAYKIGDLAAYTGTTYRCIQAHTAQAGWEPPNVPALWAVA